MGYFEDFGSVSNFSLKFLVIFRQNNKLTKISGEYRERVLFELNLVSLDLVSFPNLVSLFLSSENETRLTGDKERKSLDYKKMKEDEKEWKINFLIMEK